MLTPVVVVFLLLGSLVGAAREDPCLTDGCISTAGQILESRDESIQPCDDFYLHACNNWIQANQDAVVDGYASKLDQLTSLNDLIDNRLKKLLESANGNNISVLLELISEIPREDIPEPLNSIIVAYGSEHNQSTLDRLVGTAKNLFAKCLKQGVYRDTNLFCPIRCLN